MATKKDESKSAFTIGVLCTKRAGRDCGLQCVIVDLPKPGYALIDGQTRRRVVNIAHLEPSEQKTDLKKGASHADVVAAFKKLKIEARTTKPKQATAKPTKQRRAKRHEEKREAKKIVKEGRKADQKATKQSKKTPEKKVVKKPAASPDDEKAQKLADKAAKKPAK